ncbi:MAG: hypothetical protein CME71_05390 [Halobacteriovorax sp.]|nr:hypothetical protein [Halobacteriovorax sp.]
MNKVVLGTVALLLAGVSQAEVTRHQHPTEFVVKFKDASAKEFKSTWMAKAQAKQISKTGAFVVSLPKMAKASEALKDVASMDEVEWAAPNFIYEGDARESFTPSDPQFAKQRHHMIIKSQEAWGHTLGQAEVVVAVADDGFDLSHEDMVGSYYTNPNEIAGNGIDDDNNGYIDDTVGWDFNEADNNPGSDSSNGAHGTHVAGIISADFDDNIGVTGISPNVKVMPLKFYGDRRWTSAMVYETYAYAADNGAKVLTVSYNIDGFANDEVFARAVDYVDTKGVILFNSAGNGNAHQSARTKFGKILLVASTKTKEGSEDVRSSFSNYGVDVDIAAPGDPIYSHGRTNRYVDMSGTSMAAPNAAAIAGFIWSEFPEYTREQVVQKLLTSADDIDSINSDRYKYKLGAGRINAAKAVAADAGLTTIRQAWFDKGMLHVQLKGLISSITGRSAIRVERISQRGAEVVEIESETALEIGQSVLKFSLTDSTPGTYRVRMSADMLVDPFGRAIDGDLDGVEGGDYVQTLEL